MNTKEALQQVKALIADPNDWCQGEVEKINPVTARKQRCLIRAIWMVAGLPTEDCSLGFNMQSAFKEANGIEIISGFNDASTHVEVLAALDKTILSLPD